MNPADSSLYTRRAFFTELFGKSREFMAEIIKERVAGDPQQRCLRPPGALSELEFLAACTRCDDCIQACPEKVIRPLTIESGFGFKTPQVTFERGGCAWCQDFPCIQSCKSGALACPPGTSPPPIATLSVNLANCLVNQGQHCDYCKNACPSHIEPAIRLERRQPPLVDPAKCVGCGECVHMCVSQTGPVFRLEPVDR